MSRRLPKATPILSKNRQKQRGELSYLYRRGEDSWAGTVASCNIKRARGFLPGTLYWTNVSVDCGYLRSTPKSIQHRTCFRVLRLNDADYRDRAHALPPYDKGKCFAIGATRARAKASVVRTYFEVQQYIPSPSFIHSRGFKSRAEREA